MSDLIDRSETQTELMMKCERYTLARESHGFGRVEWSDELISLSDAMDVIRNMPTTESQWIPCNERLPEDIKPVNITGKNTDPTSYSQYIVGEYFTGTACYKNGKWYWYTSITETMLAEYGRYDSEEFDEGIECIAWTPLPQLYKGD